ncbi:MAG TPA: ABC transporter permease [Bacteroidales bacterium]|nr:ABC transporter permease [Bacteroidales bacterium]
MLTIIHIKNCYDTNNVILVDISKKNPESDKISEVSFQNLKKVFASNSFVESVSICTNAVPYNYSISTTGFNHDSVEIGMANREVDIDYAKVMKVVPLIGRWFDETDLGKAVHPVVITNEVNEKYFKGNAVGERIYEKNRRSGKVTNYEVIGVVDRFKRNDSETPYASAFILKDSIKAGSSWQTSFLIRTKESKTSDMLAIAESQVYSTINPESWTIGSLNSLENMRQQVNDDNYQRNYLNVIIALFVLINIFLGTIGILWYNTNLRIHEIGIKRALGSTGMEIKRLLISENLVIAGAGLLMVLIIILQIPSPVIRRGVPEAGVMLNSIIISVVSMIVLVFLSTWIPAAIASKIRPATALKTE